MTPVLRYLKKIHIIRKINTGRGGRYDQNRISRYDTFYITITNIYHDIVISFSLKKFFIILKSLIPYNFHNPCHQCQYQTNTSLKRERKIKLNLTVDNKQSVMK